MTLADQLLDPKVPLEEIARVLDAMTPAARRDALLATNRAQQRSLYQKAKAGRALTMEDFVPASISAVTQVRHYGRNTLPLLPSWRFFEKRMSRPDDGSTRAFGYNEGSTRPLIGPGYFVLLPTAGNPVFAERGSLVVDYHQVPDGKVPADWPKVVPNSVGLQMFVYKGTRDFMRRVSEGVTIGAAYKGEKALDHYFTLVREL